MVANYLLNGMILQVSLWVLTSTKVMSLHLGVLVYGMAEGTLNGPAAAQSLMRMISDSSMEEVGEGYKKLIHKRGA